jgi:hypothetical protein
MTHSTPTRLETALGSIVAAWLALSLVFVPVAFQKRGAEAHHTSPITFRFRRSLLAFGSSLVFFSVALLRRAKSKKPQRKRVPRTSCLRTVLARN